MNVKLQQLYWVKKPSLDATVDDFPALLGLGAEIWQILAYEKELRFYHC